MDWDRIPDEATIRKTIEGLKNRNFNPMVVPDKTSALAKLKEVIPAGKDVMEGASTTLIEIGFIDYLMSGKHRGRIGKTVFLPKRTRKSSVPCGVNRPAPATSWGACRR